MRALSLSKSSLYPRACVRFCARAKEIRARAGRFARKQGNPRESKGNPRASREIRAQAGRFALAHYINLLSRYKNVLSTFGSKITPYGPPCPRRYTITQRSKHYFVLSTQCRLNTRNSDIQPEKKATAGKKN